MSDRLKVYLDDVRDPPDDTWVCVRTPSEAIELLQTGRVDEITLDFDLGYDAEGNELTGYQVAVWVEEAVVLRNFKPPSMQVHSANSPGHERLLRAIESIRRKAER